MNAKNPLKWHVSVFLLILLFAGPAARSANIVLVSDNPPAANQDNQWYPPFVGYPDDFYVTLLQAAGHNVVRFNPPASQNTLLTTAQITGLNTNDLIIIGRSINSGEFQAPQSSNWNARITRPIICTSPYLVRSDGNRLTWFGGGNGQLFDTTPPTRLRGADVNDGRVQFLFDDVVMNGDTMVNSYDEVLEQNTSAITNPTTPGGKVLANATFVPRAGGAVVTGNLITEVPAGTTLPAAVGGLMAGYRMFVAAGTRELPPNDIPNGAGKDNLTPDGEKIFMRTVALALNNGVVPANTAPVGIQTGPTNTTVVENTTLSYSLVVTGAMPRFAQWQRDAGDGVTFTNIPGGGVSFGQTVMNFGKVTPADNGAFFRVVATNAFGAVTSEVAQLTVITDTTPPTIISAAGKWTLTNIYVTFSEPVDVASAIDPLNYSVDNGLLINTLSLDASGTVLTITTTPQTPGTVYMLTVNGVLDRASTPNMIVDNTTASFTAFAESRGFLVSELFLNLAAGNTVSLLTTSAKYPNNPDISGYVNVSSNAPTSPNLEQYGGRLVGWIVPPVSGNYIFYIRGDDDTELRVGGSVVASRVGANGAYQNSNPGATAVPLTGGQAYTVEALWKEGTGGDYMQFAWTPPWSTNIEAIAGGYLQTYADPVGVSVSITAQPQGASIEENRSVTFSVAASSTPANALRSYQWQKGDGAGGFTNALGAQYGSTFTTPLLQYPADDGSQWRVIVYVPGGSVTSEVATVTVSDDVTPAVVLGAGSIDGLRVGVCFNEAINTDQGIDPFTYGIDASGNIPSIQSVTLRPDGQSVILNLAPPGISGPFSLSVNGSIDLSDNITSAEVLSAVVGLTGAELGPNLQVGSEWTCDPSIFEVVGGGADIFGTADGARFDSKSVTGDFDAKVRVRDLTLTGTGGALIAKAGLMARVGGISNSPTIWILGNAPPPGRDLIELGYRAASNGTTVVWGPNTTNIHMPDMWVRLARAGNTFNTYASSNGVDWTFIAATNATLPQTLLLGTAVTAHNNVAGLASTGRFSNFSISQPVADVEIGQTANPPGIVYEGERVTFSIRVFNNGPDAANLVTVANPIPAGTTYVSSSASQGSCTLAAGVLNCSLGSIASRNEATITLILSSGAPGTIVLDSASVSSSTIDPVTPNNTSQISLRVAARPPLRDLRYDAAAGMFIFVVNTENGYSYRVQYKDHLTDAQWNTLTVLSGDGDPQAVVDPGPLPPTRFYRVLIELQQ